MGNHSRGEAAGPCSYPVVLCTTLIRCGGWALCSSPTLAALSCTNSCRFAPPPFTAGRVAGDAAPQAVNRMQAHAAAAAHCAESAALASCAHVAAALLDDHAAAASCFAFGSDMREASALGMHLPPLTVEVQHGVRDCFQLFSARSHSDLISSVSRSLCACVRVSLPHTALHDEYVFALLHAANFLDAPLLLRR